MTLKLRISVDKDTAFEFEGDAAFAGDVKPLVDQWFAAVSASDRFTQEQIDRLAARVRLANEGLDAAAKGAARPSTQQ